MDYKYRYPTFSHFEIQKDFYNSEEEANSADDYNFDLECPELDEFISKNDSETFDKIQKKGLIKIIGYNVCLVKRTHHVKGRLFIIQGDTESKRVIYFYSYNYQMQNNEKLLCNKSEKTVNNPEKKLHINNKLCFGSIFNCPQKDSNRIIKIEFKDIRLILSRIYFYRDSALEIFTETKSYYFNFYSEEKKDEILLILMIPCIKSFFPMKIDGTLIGYIKVNKKLISQDKPDELITKKDNNFINLISDKTSKGELFEMCVFDIIMLINLISNRSFNDIYQYPIFPLLFFYDKEKQIINRDFKDHIGFQDKSEKSKIRKELFLKIYNENLNEKDEDEEDDNYSSDEEGKNSHSYLFSTHYSNCVYISNYLIRFFPYSFIAIELQGNGFDSPNRLFFSIEDTFYNISTQKSDLRELIPEFFYFPEIFMNVNNIDFHKRTNDIQVDDVIMPKILSVKYKYKNDFNLSESKAKDSNNKNENIEKCFIFIEDMKNKLENLTKDLSLWINIIFGLNQQYSAKEQSYFRPESFINLKEKENFKHYMEDDLVMSSVEFGIIPMQTIFENKTLDNLCKRKIDYNNNSKANNTELEKTENSNSKLFDFNANSEYWDENIPVELKVNNEDVFGKLELHINKVFVKYIVDFNDKLIEYFYNRRLNMYAVSSFDGFIYVYILPDKLFSMIKSPNNSYFDKVFLCSNPYPIIIGFERTENTIATYSVNGIMIKRLRIKNIFEDDKDIIDIKPQFNIYGGNTKDKLIIRFKSDEKIYTEYYNLPFLDIDK